MNEEPIAEQDRQNDSVLKRTADIGFDQPVKMDHPGKGGDVDQAM